MALSGDPFTRLEGLIYQPVASRPEGFRLGEQLGDGGDGAGEGKPLLAWFLFG